MNAFKLTTWNCKGGFARKHARVLDLDPDVLVLPECGNLTDIPQELGAKPLTGAHWIGENRTKGLAVMAYGGYTLEVDEAYDPSIQWIVPINVCGPVSFTLIAVWTVPDPQTRHYISPLIAATDRYADLFKRKRLIIAGDFNQNVLLDTRSAPTFTELMRGWDAFGLASLYHEARDCAHGAELEPTFFMHHNKAKPHHLDYIFASRAMRHGPTTVHVGDPGEWLALSDHMPLSASVTVP